MGNPVCTPSASSYWEVGIYSSSWRWGNIVEAGGSPSWSCGRGGWRWLQTMGNLTCTIFLTSGQKANPTSPALNSNTNVARRNILYARRKQMFSRRAPRTPKLDTMNIKQPRAAIMAPEKIIEYLTPFNFRPPLIFGRGWPKIRGAEKV